MKKKRNRSRRRCRFKSGSGKLHVAPAKRPPPCRPDVKRDRVGDGGLDRVRRHHQPPRYRPRSAEPRIAGPLAGTHSPPGPAQGWVQGSPGPSAC